MTDRETEVVLELENQGEELANVVEIKPNGDKEHPIEGASEKTAIFNPNQPDPTENSQDVFEDAIDPEKQIEENPQETVFEDVVNNAKDETSALEKLVDSNSDLTTKADARTSEFIDPSQTEHEYKEVLQADPPKMIIEEEKSEVKNPPNGRAELNAEIPDKYESAVENKSNSKNSPITKHEKEFSNPVLYNRNSTSHQQKLISIHDKGLANYGNTCYINSVLQILLNTHEFTSALATASCEMSLALRALSLASTESHRTHYLVEVLRQLSNIDPKWADGQQRDSKELFLSLLTNIFNSGDKQITQVFYGLKTSIYSLDCSHAVINEQKFGFLNGGRNSISDYITKIIRRFIDPSEESQQLEFYCNECNLNTYCSEARKVELPKILGIYFDNNMQQSVNLNTHFSIRTGFHKLQLRGVIQRMGQGANFGHFRAYYMVDNSWYLFDDSCVSLCKQKEINSAYMLFYKVLE
jgi:hypothetical protein